MSHPILESVWDAGSGVYDIDRRGVAISPNTHVDRRSIRRIFARVVDNIFDQCAKRIGMSVDNDVLAFKRDLLLPLLNKRIDIGDNFLTQTLYMDRFRLAFELGLSWRGTASRADRSYVPSYLNSSGWRGYRGRQTPVFCPN